MTLTNLSEESPEVESDESASALFLGDTGVFDLETRLALVKLLRGPFLDGAKEPARWAALRRSETAVRRFLSEIFLGLVIDENESIAFTEQATEADAGVPTVLRQVPLTMVDSALVVYLRQELSAVAGTGQRSIVGFDDIIAQLSPYRRESSTDQSAHVKRINGSVRKMIDAGVLANTATDGRYEVSPVLRILFPAEQIAALTTSYESLRSGEITLDETRVEETDGEPA